MPTPWLQSWVLGLINDLDPEVDYTSSSNKYSVNRKNQAAKVVQITAVNEMARALTINDTKNTLMAFITPDCYEAITADGPLKDLQGSLVKLAPGSYHLSTVFVGCGTRDLKALREAKTTSFSLPLALQLGGLRPMGAHDCHTFTMADGAEPVDVNRDEVVRGRLLGKLKYADMVQRLGMCIMLTQAIGTPSMCFGYNGCSAFLSSPEP